MEPYPREWFSSRAKSIFESWSDAQCDLYEEARFRIRTERFRPALRTLASLRKQLPRCPLVLALRAGALASVGELEEAEASIRESRLLPGASRWPVPDTLAESTELTARLRERRRDGRREARRIQAERAEAKAARLRKTTEVTEARGTLPAAEVPLRITEAAPSEVLVPTTGDGTAPTPATALLDWRLRQGAVRIEAMRRFDTLLSLGTARGVDHYDYQLRTVRRVLRDFRGRALLADEVGLGKTIEAALCLEEYLLRGLVGRALLLVPPSLVPQWKDELIGKFGREVVVVDGAHARNDPDVWTTAPLVLTSMALARREPHASRLRQARFDMVIVDEAHRLKNRRTLLWRLVEAIKSRFLLLLSATPIQNDLLEIYNVLSLLRPGLFSTAAEFKQAFVAGRRRPKDPSRLRGLLREVMIRNTRAVAEAKLPPRFVTTLRAAAEEDEAAFYRDLAATVRRRLAEGSLRRGHAGEVLRAAGARPQAAAPYLARYLGEDLAARARALRQTGKDRVFLDLLRRRPDDKILVFATHTDTLPHLVALAEQAGRRPVLFSGTLGAVEKARAIEAFRDDADCLIASEAGGEGHNLQFARTIVNYDLPWNPMRIEQRIGRVHRIGQTEDVFVFNLVAQGTVEEEILRVLDEKINMFELVVGEVEGILGRLGDDEQEFAGLVLDIYTDAEDDADARARFDALADRMAGAKGEHEKVKAFEEQVFGRDLEA